MLPLDFAALNPGCILRRIIIDNGLVFGYKFHRISLIEGAFREGTFEGGASAVPARGMMRSAPGRPWGTGRPAKGPVRTERA